ncbi:MAG: hypothetical protein EP348_04800, partial [Alphaproteobacteria bacterium]
REREAAAAAAVHRLTLARENLDQEEERARRAKQQLEERKNQISSDMVRERNLEKDAEEAVTRLEAEKKELEAASENETPLAEQLREEVNALQKTLNEIQAEFDKKTETIAAETAERNSLTRQIETENTQLSRIAARLDDALKEKAGLEVELGQSGSDGSGESALKNGLARLAELTKSSEAAEAARQKADEAERANRDKVKQAETEVTRLEAEAKALSSLLENNDAGEWPGIIEALTVTSGYEVALGAALGDELDAPDASEADVFWQTIEAKASQDFDGNLPSLDKFVKGHGALERRLSQIAIVEASKGAALQASLKFGQRLVSKEGDLWRWDGYTRKAGAKTAAAIRLEQRNRLEEVTRELADRQKVLDKAQGELKSASEILQQSIATEKELRARIRTEEQEVSKLRAQQAEEIRRAAAKQSRLASLTDAAKELETEKAGLAAGLKENEAQLAALPDGANSRAEIERLREELQAEREDLAAKRSESDQKQREAAHRRDRLSGIDQEIATWIDRNRNMAEHFVQLEMRFQSTDQELKELDGKPEEIAAKRADLMDEIARAEGGRASARDKLAEAESVLAQCDAALRKCQEALASCREERVRHQSETEHTAQVLTGLCDQIREKLDCKPDQIRAAGDIGEDEAIPDVADSERRVERLKKERDGMGPVNLRAEIEAKEVEEQLQTLSSERQDLEAAIARLRQGISSLNREGRQRLLAAFKQVDQHFQELFKQVFGGGSAHLTLTESDDPLAAGLEIMASPPGKKLQLMSLLSGGEQALTAVALLFAVFLTNPAPICVLDEVDAPLDDVNVERLCNLLIKIAEHSDTRFLVVTHHPITMARMDRLFGVTMAERGVSQLVSVDLEQAKEITETAA